MNSEKAFSFFKLLRIENATLPLLSFFIGLGFAGTFNNKFNSYVIIVLIALTAYATLQNDIKDKLIDIANKRTSSYIDGTFSKQFIQHVCWYLLLLVAITVLLSQSVLLGVGAYIALALTIAYNIKPFQFSRKPISSIVVLAILLGFIPALLGLGTDIAFTSVWLLVILGLSLQRFSLSILKDYKDYIGDKKYNKKTFLLTYGPNATKTVSILFGFIGYLSILMAFMIQFNNIWIVALLVMCAAFSIWYRFSLGANNKRNTHVFINAQKINALFELGFIGCLFIL